MKRIFVLSVTILSLSLLSLHAQDYRNHSALTLENIMKGEEWTGTWPKDVKWSADGQKVYFTWNPERDLLPSTYSWTRGTGKIEKVPEAELPYIIPGDSDVNRVTHEVVYARAGQLYLRDLTAPNQDFFSICLPPSLHRDSPVMGRTSVSSSMAIFTFTHGKAKRSVCSRISTRGKNRRRNRPTRMPRKNGCTVNRCGSSGSCGKGPKKRI